MHASAGLRSRLRERHRASYFRQHRFEATVMTIYKGSCHCGRAQFEVNISNLKEVRVCDCSICVRRGALNVRVEEQDMKIISNLEDLTLYQFNTMTAKDYFCPVCGILPFRRPRTAPDLWTVNVRCLEGVDLDQLETRRVHGSKLSSV